MHNSRVHSRRIVSDDVEEVTSKHERECWRRDQARNAGNMTARCVHSSPEKGPVY